MDNDYDTLLGRLSTSTVDPRLAMGRGQVMSRIAAGERSGASNLPLQFGALAALALALGMASAGLPGAPLQAAPVLTPFAPNAPLAPSSLLVGAQ